MFRIVKFNLPGLVDNPASSSVNILLDANTNNLVLRNCNLIIIRSDEDFNDINNDTMDIEDEDFNPELCNIVNSKNLTIVNDDYSKHSRIKIINKSRFKLIITNKFEDVNTHLEPLKFGIYKEDNLMLLPRFSSELILYYKNNLPYLWLNTNI
tara:strand:- start:84 stop:542 length:459 start_codon:yes stop_codon:yes gene_type:complete